MERSTKLKIAALAAVAVSLAIALGAAGAIAASRALSDDESQAVIDDAAGRLGVEPSELSDALREALRSRVDQAVEDGRLTEEEGELLKERIDEGELPLFGGFGKHRGLGDLHFHGESVEAAASYLGLSEDELRERLRDGDTLAEVADEEGKSVDGLVDTLVTSASDRIDEAVESGRLTEEQGTELKEDLEERVTDLVNGELRLGPPFGKAFGHGFGFRDHPGRGPRA